MTTLAFSDAPAFLADVPERAALIIPIPPDVSVENLDQELLSVDVATHLKTLIETGVVALAAGELLTSFVNIDGRAVRLICVGTGMAEAGSEELRAAIGEAVRAVPRSEAVAVFSPPPLSARAATEGLLLGDYRFDHYKETPQVARPAVGIITTPGNSDEIAAGQIVADAVMLARDLGNTPPSRLTPEGFAQRAQEECARLSLHVTTWDAEQLRDQGFGGITGVGIGSANPPMLMKIEYLPSEARGHVSFVGKGITFDSGGLGIKPRPAMLWMKCDMGGAAAVFAALIAIAKLRLPLRATAWLALAENMPSGRATKPLDVLTMKNGVTVEVADTDAEGRLVLADALVVAAEEHPDLLIDVATLTGAQIVALGNRTSAVMARSGDHAEVVLEAAARAGELMWQLPMPEHLAKLLDSPVADLANMGGNEGGVIVGAHFLDRFVPPQQPWVHIDIAGPAINTGSPHGYTNTGATGAAVRTLVDVAHSMSAPLGGARGGGPVS